MSKDKTLEETAMEQARSETLILRLASQLDPDEMTLMDQITFVMAYRKLIKELKPLVEKYVINKK